MKVRYFDKRGECWVDFRDASGTRKRVPSTFKTEAEAKRNIVTVLAKYLSPAASPAPGTTTTGAEAHAQAASPSGTSPQVERAASRNAPTFEAAFEQALKTREKWMQAKDKSGLRGTFEQVTAYWGKDTPLSKATREAVLKWREAMLKEPGKRVSKRDAQGKPTEYELLSNSTINHRLTMLSVLLDESNLPPHTVKHLSVKNSVRKRRVRDKELQAVQAWLLQNHTRKGALSFNDLISVALLTGARQGELLALLWTDCYLERGEALARDTKNGEARTLHLSDAASRILERRQETHKVGPFADLDSDRCTALWRDARKAIGLEDDPEFVFHVATRHEALSRLGDTDHSAFVIQAVAGHKNITTSARYVKLGSDAGKRAAQAIAAYGRKVPEPTGASAG